MEGKVFIVNDDVDIILDQLIDFGNYGYIYQSIFYEKKINRKTKVAVKIINKGKSEMEQHILGVIGRNGCHKNILKPYCTIDSKTFATKLYNPNFSSLCQEYRDNGDINEILQLGKGILNGMSFLKQNNIIHNDIKPSNIVLDKHNNPVLIDFGFSKTGSKTYKDDKFHGTPIYVSPERLNMREYTYSSDIYSFGILLWEIITGGSPYITIKTIEELKLMVTFNRLRPPLNKIDLTSIKMLLAECWNRTPSRRPSPDELIEKIDGIIERGDSPLLE